MTKLKDKKEKVVKEIDSKKVSTPKEAEVKKEKAAEVSSVKIGNYTIEKSTGEFSLNRLLLGSGKRHFILLAILKLSVTEVKKGATLTISDILKEKESLAGKREIAYGLIGKYNRFLIANNLAIRVKSKGLAVEGKKVLMARTIEVYIPKKD